MKINNKILFLILYIFIYSNCKSIPEGKEGKQAEQLAKKMLDFANISAWEKTEAVEFTFAGIRHHLWDKKRNYIFYQKGDIKVFYKKENLKGKVYIQNQEIHDSESVQANIQEAYKAFVNDFFWLQPAFHIYSPGARRFYIQDHQLRVTFTKGGITPGDTYVFDLDSNGKIISMRMWVQILPVKGIKANFIDYFTTETGVKIARVRTTFLKDIHLSHIKFYSQYPPSDQKDIFENIHNYF